ncbi:CMKLR1 [Mytilus coruscus]|uniref:CMKLR1 n=1 Tax=Mytilus coruscus TaxID=42192 RepID=A0A6J8D8R4_MYTCO|nr:CMKLR1 [Mytilus coruscus]
MLFILYARSPFWLNIVAGPTASYISIVMNIIIFCVLLDRKIKTPTTVLMQGLALTDSLTALCTYGFEPLFVIFYDKIGSYVDLNITGKPSKDFSRELTELVSLKFPLCWVHFVVSNLIDTSHLASILITTSLGVQKLLAVMCPIWSRTKVTHRKAGIVCGVCVVGSMVMSIPRLCVVGFKSGKEDICLVSDPHANMQKYVLTFYPILLSVILFTAVVTMLVSTFYIIVILCRRKHVRGHASASKSEKKSCMLILSVMVVFLLSEIPRLYINTTLFFTYSTNMENNENIAVNKITTESHKNIISRLELDIGTTHYSNLTLYDNCTRAILPPLPYQGAYDRQIQRVLLQVMFKDKYQLNLLNTLRYLFSRFFHEMRKWWRWIMQFA